MLELKDLASELRKILFRFEQYCAPNCQSLVQVEMANPTGEPVNFCGLLAEIELVGEVPDLVILRLKLTPESNQTEDTRHLPNPLVTRSIQLAKAAFLSYLDVQILEQILQEEEAPNLDNPRLLCTPELEGSDFLDMKVREWWEANAQAVFDEWKARARSVQQELRELVFI